MGTGDVGEFILHLSRSDRLLDWFQRTARVSLSLDISRWFLLSKERGIRT